jgi:hypothetical protein
VVAHGHGLVAHLVHKALGFLALVLGVEKGALKFVAGIHQEHIASLGADFGDFGRPPRHSAKAFAGGSIRLAAIPAGAVELQDVSVHVVGMQHS